MAFRFRHGKKVKKRKINIFHYVIAAAIVIGCIFVGLFVVYRINLRPVNPSNDELVIFTVEEGMNEAQVSGMLETKGLIRSSLAYEMYVRLNGKVGKMMAGGYKISQAMSVPDIAYKLTSGDVATDLVTILPAQRLDQLRAYFISIGYSEAEVDDALDPENYAGHPALANKPPLASLEGYLYPESFQRTTTTPLKIVIEASLDQMANLLNEERVQQLQAKGLSVHDAIILASMVEKEVSNEADKPTVAQVFLRRLEQGMMLGSDVTAYYGAEVAGLPPTVSTDTPYNTRLYVGLPPGPISNVSASSLEAVINPSNTDYLFFVAGDDGVTYFSHTVEEHEALAEQHCKVLCAIP